MVDDDLKQLRDAARGREWSVLQETLARLFMQLEFYLALEIPLTRLHDHAAVFERDHPGATWARKLLVSAASFGIAPAELPPEAAQPYASPGAANFLAGLFDLLRGMEGRTPAENRARFLASAVSNAVLADLAAFWYGQHPDAWASQQQRGGETDPDTGLTLRQRIYGQFWLDDAVAERDTAAWLAVADSVEKKLKRL